MAEPAQSVENGAGAAPPVAVSAPPNPPAAPPPGSAATTSPADYGGNRGGRAREDGLTPGSPEALEADRKKDRLRKKQARKAKQPDPPPLPSAAAVEGAPAAAPGAVGPAPGPEGAAPIPWDPESLREVFDLAIPTAEELMVGQIISQAKKCNLPVDLVKKTEERDRLTSTEKLALQKFAPRATAKYLNRLHVPSGTQDEIVLLTVVAKIGLRHLSLLNQLKQIAANQQAAAKPPEKTDAKKD
jgi:hypothetical protein